jgi:hypothetical protein
VTAPAELVIEVTADDIRLGVPCDASHCPVALAVRRLYPGASAVMVGGYSDREIEVSWASGWTAYAMPDEALGFVLRFDDMAAGEAAPFAFTAPATGGPS